VIRYDREFNRSTTGQFEPVEAGRNFSEWLSGNETVDNAEVDDNEKVGGIKREAHSDSFQSQRLSYLTSSKVKQIESGFEKSRFLFWNEIRNEFFLKIFCINLRVRKKLFVGFGIKKLTGISLTEHSERNDEKIHSFFSDYFEFPDSFVCSVR
jgi:hypothetical protein